MPPTEFDKQRKLANEFMKKDTPALKAHLKKISLSSGEKSFVMTRAWYYAKNNKADPDTKYPYSSLKKYLSDPKVKAKLAANKKAAEEKRERKKARKEKLKEIEKKRKLKEKKKAKK